MSLLLRPPDDMKPSRVDTWKRPKTTENHPFYYTVYEVQYCRREKRSHLGLSAGPRPTAASAQHGDARERHELPYSLSIPPIPPDTGCEMADGIDELGENTHPHLLRTPYFSGGLAEMLEVPWGDMWRLCGMRLWWHCWRSAQAVPLAILTAEAESVFHTAAVFSTCLYEVDAFPSVPSTQRLH